MSANSPITSQWIDSDQQDPSSNQYALSGRIMLVSMVTLFIVVVFLVLLHLYARWYLTRINRHPESPNRLNRRNRPPRIVYYINNNNNWPPASASPTGGLDPLVLNSLPMFVYSSKTDTNCKLECAVCLSEFEDGEKGRVLVNCKHRFHTSCIDMWFFSNSTCPLCRAPVEPIGPVNNAEENENLGTNHVAVFVEPGSSVEVGETASLGDRRDLGKRVDIRIDVPNRDESVVGPERELRLQSPSQGFRSPGSRLLSLKRIISMSRKSPVVSPSASGGPSSSVAVGIETDREPDQESSRH